MKRLLKNKSNTIIITLIFSIILSVLFCSIAYSALSTTMMINGLAYARPQADVRITDFSIYDANDATSSYEEFSKETISTNITFNNSSSATYKVEVTNYGEPYVGISKITGIPNEITYEIEDYELKDKLCNDNGKCNKVAAKTFYITFYGTNTTVDMTLNFEFNIYYDLTYYNFENTNYPPGILENETIMIDTSSDSPKLISVEGDSIPTTNFDSNTQKLTISNVNSDLNIVAVKQLDYNYNYTNDYQTFTAPATGIYKVQLWGAAGGSSLANGLTEQGSQGQGAYTSGYIKLNRNQKIYIYVGGRGTDGTAGTNVNGGYNGGGSATWDGTDDESAGGGGGATDVRLTNGEWNDFNSLKSRIMVAAGGGSYVWTVQSAASSGGGLQTDIYGKRLSFYQITEWLSYLSDVPNTTQTTGYAFGIGQNGSGVGKNSDGSPGAGGGYYGGKVSLGTVSFDAAAGGSSFISGHNGCDAISETSTSSSIVHTGQDIHYSGYQFANTQMIDGEGYLWYTEKTTQTSIPSYDGTTTLSGYNDGYAKITIISTDKKIHNITYTGIDNLTADQVVDGSTYTINFGSAAPEVVKVTMNGVRVTNYTYSEGILTIPNVTGNLNIEGINATYAYKYTGALTRFEVPYSGKYEIHLWGASGGYGVHDNVHQYEPGKGGYTYGQIELAAGDGLYISVGGKGENGATVDYVTGGTGGFNGGGNGGSDNNEFDDQADPAGGGGGATDIRYGGMTVNNRIMVAAGGGGSAYDGAGGHGGGLNGYPGNLTSILGGTQTTGYAFGNGANGIDHQAGTGGGGGGYWGGNTGTYSDESGAGGSSYISGYTGCVAIASSSSLLPKTGCADGTTDISCSYHFSGKKFTNAIMYSGGETYPTHPGIIGEGYAIIKLIEAY